MHHFLLAACAIRPRACQYFSLVVLYLTGALLVKLGVDISGGDRAILCALVAILTAEPVREIALALAHGALRGQAVHAFRRGRDQSI